MAAIQISELINKSPKYNGVISYLIRLYYKIRCYSTQSFIFVATTGRSGTMTLVDLLNNIPHCKAEHEPYPAMFNDILKEKSLGNESVINKVYWRVKSVNIRRTACGYRHYLESNHMFIKTYIEYAVKDFGEKIRVIHIARDPIKVANSIYALQDFPGTVEGNKWWLDYTATNNLIYIPEYLDNDAEFKHPFYKGLWYWYEIEARIEYWKEKLPQINFIKFNTEDFNDSSKVSALLTTLGIEFDPESLVTKINIQSNTRPHQKISGTIPIEQASVMHDRFVKLLANLKTKQR